jgi:hypothetical protein
LINLEWCYYFKFSVISLKFFYFQSFSDFENYFHPSSYGFRFRFRFRPKSKSEKFQNLKVIKCLFLCKYKFSLTQTQRC